MSRNLSRFQIRNLAELLNTTEAKKSKMLIREEKEDLSISEYELFSKYLIDRLREIFEFLKKCGHAHPKHDEYEDALTKIQEELSLCPLDRQKRYFNYLISQIETIFEIMNDKWGIQAGKK